MKKKYLGIFAIFAIALLGIGAVSAFGMGQGKMLGLDEEEKTEMEAFRLEVQNAVQNGDYETWKSLVESKISEENFEKIQSRWIEREAQKAETQGSQFEGFPGKGDGIHKEMRGQRMGGQGNLGNCPFA
jgi:hypothetical protein